jgi:hypothetical protein
MLDSATQAEEPLPTFACEQLYAQVFCVFHTLRLISGGIPLGSMLLLSCAAVLQLAVAAHLLPGGCRGACIP